MVESPPFQFLFILPSLYHGEVLGLFPYLIGDFLYAGEAGPDDLPADELSIDRIFVVTHQLHDSILHIIPVRSLLLQ